MRGIWCTYDQEKNLFPKLQELSQVKLWIIFCNIVENVLKQDEPEGRTKQSILSNCREYLANYQKSCGTPRTEYSFAALIMTMAQTAARSLWALIYVIVNIAPIIQVTIQRYLYILS